MSRYDKRQAARKRYAQHGIYNVRTSDKTVDRLERHQFQEPLRKRGIDALGDNSTSPPVIVHILFGVAAFIGIATLLGKPPINPFGVDVQPQTQQVQPAPASTSPDSTLSTPSGGGWSQQ